MTEGGWLVCARPNPAAALRLLCVPYAGGGVHVFRGWADALPEAVEVCAVELPGRGARLREPPCPGLVPLVEALADGLRPHLDRPFALFGHSMGGLLCFELARELRRRSAPGPVRLLVSAHRPPQAPIADAPIHALPEPEFLAELRRLNGTPDEVLASRELMDLLLPALRADFEACETYTYSPEPPLGCPITVFGGWEDVRVEPESLDGWRDQTTAEFSVRMLSGGHFFVHTERDLLVAELARELSRLPSATTHSPWR